MLFINKLSRLAIVFLFVFMGTLSVFNCGKPPDQKAYEEILATMSMEKAKRFFVNYPESPYKDKLIHEMIVWCQQENTEESYKMVIDALPKDHPRYNEIMVFYQKHFTGKK